MSNAAGNIIQILADLPDFLRRPMLKNRLKEFYTMTDKEKHETIEMALSAAPLIDQKKLSVLFRTWLEVLAEFDPENRIIMFQTYCKQILTNKHSIERLDFASLTSVFLSLDEKQRERLNDSLHEVLFSIPNRNEIIKIVPETTLKAIGLR